MSDRTYPAYGHIYFYRSSRHSGDTKIRPGIVVSKDAVNAVSETVQIVPLTKHLDVQEGMYAIRFMLPSKISFLEHDSIVMCDKATTILSSRIVSLSVGILPEEWISHLKNCLAMSHENKPVMFIGAGGR
ncbi:MAG TPA: type II toxin-antitoxin system PemK/MazF family toxin [Chromatiales bacterium]|nr:type II toxin-antitoxin system PemK/MazF family toxin [Chromatiales bacterium]